MENYKTTKTVRFKLEAETGNIPEIQKDAAKLKGKGIFDLANFVAKLDNYIDDINEYLFKMKKDESFIIDDSIIIKPVFVKNYAKQEWVDFRERNKQNNSTRRVQNTIHDFNGLSAKIEQVISDIEDIYVGLASDASVELNERARREHTGLLLKRLQAKNALEYLVTLIENSNRKNEDGDLSLRLKKQAKDIMEQLKAGIYDFLPAQSNGLPIAKASFNYYTINKKPIDFKKEIEKLEESLKVNVESEIRREINVYTEVKSAIVNDVLGRANGKKILLGEVSAHEGEGNASLRQILKNIKSKQKETFNEFMTKNPRFEELRNNKDLYLFSNIVEKEFLDYERHTQNIENIAKQINQSKDDYKLLRPELQKLKKQRGDLISAANKKNGNENKFKTYKSFANFYRKIAQKHGKILAQLKGIEKERIESDMLKYWAVIVEFNNQHKLVLIPIEKARDCKEWLEKAQKENNPHQNGDFNIFWFESFTYRSLQKLCFGNIESGTNTFNETIQDLLPKDKEGKGEFVFEGDEHKKIEFYKEVLKQQTTLKLPEKEVLSEIINKKFNSLNDFQIALEKICYLRFVALPANAEHELRNEHNAQIFNITSFDLKNFKNVKEKQENFKHFDKHHTQIWRDFWTDKNEQNNFEIRLNPEITITYRLPKQSKIDKYDEGKELYDKKKNNRYLHPQFTLITTISEHSNSPTKIFSFMSDEEFKISVNDFNKKIKKENIKFAIGIDNGETELSTIGIYLPIFKKSTNEEKIAELKKVEKYGFKVLTIRNLRHAEKDYNGKDKKIVQNSSYFIDKDLYMRTFNKSEQEYRKMFAEQFEEKHSLTLDLSTAKMICGHIVTNGGIMELFNLWIKHAQRNIFEMNDHNKKGTARKLHLKNELETYKEKLKFAEYISKEKKFTELNDELKQNYIKWIFEDRYQLNFTDDEHKKFRECQKKLGDYREGILFASCYIDDELQSVTDIFDCRHIFKERKEFYSIESEKSIKKKIDSFNTNRTSHNISNEELDFKIVNVKKALVANAIGVIDFLYKQYKQRFNGEGLIIKEGFDTEKTNEDIEKFSGNIYRILERKLYQKFQNYGLVPPIKSLMAVRANGIKNDKDKILRLGNIGFIDPDGTSQGCPVCDKGKLNHTPICSKNCGFDCNGIMHSNDGIAGFNIAKRGFENFIKEQ